MRISLVEYGVQNYPKGMEKFRLYRIEYGGHAESCLCEGLIWLPQGISADYFEGLLEGMASDV